LKSVVPRPRKLLLEELDDTGGLLRPLLGVQARK